MALKSSLLAGSTLVFGALGVSAQAATDAYDGNWHFSVTPYLWLPAVSGSVDTDTPGRPGPNGEPRQIKVSGDVNPDSYLSNLQMAFMLTADARKGPWSILTDIMYTDFGDQDTHLRNIAGLMGGSPPSLRATPRSISAPPSGPLPAVTRWCASRPGTWT